MKKSPYTEALESDLKTLDDENPFANIENTTKEKTSSERTKLPSINEKRKSNNYFSLLLDSEFSDIEAEIRGLRKVKYKEGNKMVEEYEKKENHYLTDDGAEFLLSQLKMHIPADMKLGHVTSDEFKTLMDIFREEFLEFIQDHMNSLGMYSYEEQNKGLQLGIAIINRVRMVYSRSINGTENRRSHDDINLSGKLEGDKEDRFNLDNLKN